MSEKYWLIFVQRTCNSVIAYNDNNNKSNSNSNSNNNIHLSENYGVMIILNI